MSTGPSVGDVIFSSGGYDCTLVSFYEVVKKSGSFVTLCKLGKGVLGSQGEGPTRYVVPTSARVGEPFRRKVKDYGSFWSVAVSSYEFAQEVFAGQAVSETAPGWY